MGPHIDQSTMEAMMDGLVDRTRMVDGKPTSLADLGYLRIGMDDNWQACGTGINGSFHSASGEPLFNTTRFPDVKAMNAKAHKLGLKSDWYVNNCICPEKGLLVPGFADAGNARALPALGFDGVKIDGCGQDRNVTRFAVLVDAAAAGKPITIEDCNDDPNWDRGSEDVSRFYNTGCRVCKALPSCHNLTIISPSSLCHGADHTASRSLGGDFIALAGTSLGTGKPSRTGSNRWLGTLNQIRGTHHSR